MTHGAMLLSCAVLFCNSGLCWTVLYGMMLIVLKNAVLHLLYCTIQSCTVLVSRAALANIVAIDSQLAAEEPSLLRLLDYLHDIWPVSELQRGACKHDRTLDCAVTYRNAIHCMISKYCTVLSVESAKRAADCDGLTTDQAWRACSVPCCGGNILLYCTVCKERWPDLLLKETVLYRHVLSCYASCELGRGPSPPEYGITTSKRTVT